MKIARILSVVTLVLWVAAGPILAQTPSSTDEAFMNYDKMMSVLKVDSLIGDPIQVGDTIIVPFSRISYGLGAGGAMMAYGGGMGGKTIPLGVLIIEGEDVRVELFPFEEKKPSFFQEMLPVLIKMLPEIMGKKTFSSGPSSDKSSESPAVQPPDFSLEHVIDLFQEERYQEALDSVDSLIAADPGNAELHAWKGSILGNLAQGDNPADLFRYGMGAMQEFEKALELDPENIRARIGRGAGRLLAPEGFGGSIDGAIEDFEAVLKKEAVPEAHYYLGEAYKRKGLLDLARENYQKALALNPDYKEAEKALAEIKKKP